jgi:hypothetical protein
VQEPREDEGQRGSSGGGEKDRMERIGDGGDVGGVEARREPSECGGIRGCRHVHSGLDPPIEVACEVVGEDGAEAGDADRASDLAEEDRARRGDTELSVVTAFWTARTSTWMTIPRPSPSTSM